LQNYINDIEASGFSCYWSPEGKWIRAHGDSKSRTGGKCWTETMKGNDGKYKVRVQQGKAIVLNFDMPGNSEPSDDDVVTELKKHV
jgi:hypothetical protein